MNARVDGPVTVRPWRRWAACFTLVTAAHITLAVALVYSPDPVQPGLDEGAPVVVELAEFVMEPSVAQATNAVPLEQAEAVPPEVEPEVLPEPEPVPKQAEPVEAPVEPQEIAQAETQDTIPVPEPVEEQVPEDPRETEASDQPVDPLLAQKVAESSEAIDRQAVAQKQARVASQRASWQALVRAHLEKHKRYPHMARTRREQGIAQLHFKMNRRGKVLDSSLTQTSGSFILDREVQRVIKRAQPLPNPPAEIEGDVLELVWPVEFALH